MATRSAGSKPPETKTTPEPKKTLPNKTKEDFSDYFTDSKEQYLTGCAVTHGPLKAGKTFFAMTISDSWPDGLKMEENRSIESIGEERWKKLKEVVLEDVIHLSYDLGGLDGFPQFKIKVPSINVRALIKKFKAPQGVINAGKALAQYGDAHPDLKFLIEDTVSAKDRLLLEYFDAHPVMGKDGVTEDKFAKYASLKSAHIRSHNVNRNTGLMLHYLAHSKAAPEAITTMQKNVDATMELPSINDAIEPEITGQSLKVYMGDASLIGVLFAIEDLKNPGTYKRVYYPFGGKNFTGGNRLQSRLKLEMVPHLGEIIRDLKS